MNLVLTGPRASGKTTTGRILSSLLDKAFVDTDDLVEKREGRSIEEIVRTEGWPYFRGVEKEIVSEVSENDGLIIALGGGAILSWENRQVLKKRGFVIWLRAQAEILYERIVNDGSTVRRRPSLSGKGLLDEIREVLTEREPLYRGFSDMWVDTSFLDAFRVAGFILLTLREMGIRV